MSGKSGALWCLERGMHKWRRVALGVDMCADCKATQLVDVTDEEIASYQQLLDELR